MYLTAKSLKDPKEVKLAEHLAGLIKITEKAAPTGDKNHNLDRYAIWHAKGCTFAASFFLVTAIKGSRKEKKKKKEELHG